ncbi:hypothetical protein SAMN05216236_13148 [Sedimentitalea nanhaiensis]|uniref:Uncharacterized protein n=1 Tax=Sedimentitalea nanhaiensis TaxID=999627 RepID=A0A1I7DNW2_9RHOB|nr:hypothetical protein SAMN05216236_13148 [Sedimentitalea nanhaiensis]
MFCQVDNNQDPCLRTGIFFFDCLDSPSEGTGCFPLKEWGPGIPPATEEAQRPPPVRQGPIMKRSGE